MRRFADASKRIDFRMPWLLYPAGYSLIFATLWLKPALQTLTYSLDPSFIYGVEKAAINHISFGNHFISTYGPLGYAAQNFLPQEVGRTMAWQIMSCIAVGIGVYVFSRLYLKNLSRLKVGLLTLTLLFALALSVNEWIYLNIFILYLFIYIGYNQRNRQYFILGLSALGATLTLVKFTIGFGSIGALLLAIAFGPMRRNLKHIAYDLSLSIVSYLTLLTLLGYWLGTNNIIAYITSGVGISSGFSDAMSFITPSTAIATKLLLLAFVVFIVWLLLRSNHEPWRYSFLLPPLYIVWKYAIVRQDIHILVVLYTILPLILLFIFTIRKVTWVDALLALVIAFCCLVGVAVNGDNGSNSRYVALKSSMIAPITNVQSLRFFKFWEVKSEEHYWSEQTQSNLLPAVLPAAMRQTIANAGVDIFPYDTDIVLANNLTWDPRPSPFSFETYTRRFDEDNANFFNSNGSKFIIIHRRGGNGITGIDGRYVFWDEPLTLQSILKHYKYIASNYEFILLERTSTLAGGRAATISAKTKIGSSWTSIPKSTKPICADIYIKNTLSQVIKNFALRERPFYLNLRYEDGATSTYRFVRETAPDGLLVSPVPSSWENVISFFQHNDMVDSVTALQVTGESSTLVQYQTCT